MDGKSNKLLSLSEIPPLNAKYRSYKFMCNDTQELHAPSPKQPRSCRSFLRIFLLFFFSLVHDIGVCKCITNPYNSSYRNVTFLELKPILRLLFLLESEQFLLYLCYNQAVCYNKRNRTQKPKPSVMFRSCPLKCDPPERKYSSFNLPGP